MTMVSIIFIIIIRRKYMYISHIFFYSFLFFVATVTLKNSAGKRVAGWLAREFEQ